MRGKRRLLKDIAIDAILLLPRRMLHSLLLLRHPRGLPRGVHGLPRLHAGG